MSEPKSIKEIVMDKKAGKVELNSSAFGVVKNPQDGMWTLVKITYNIQTNDVGKIEVLRSEPDRATMIESFKIEVANSGMLG